jgi:hypothetical protein
LARFELRFAAIGPINGEEKEKNSTTGTFWPVRRKVIFMMPPNSPRPVFGQPGWRRRMEAQYGWDKEFKAAGVILFLIFLSLVMARAGDDTGLPGDDPKDATPTDPEVSTTSVSDMFLPMPEWSRFKKMPPLPDVLKPMGASAEPRAKPATAAVAETKPDGAPPPKPAPKAMAPQPDADLVAISPFLQWVKDHPDAAAQARKQAADDATTTAPAGAPTPANASADPYWMPPMVDAPDASAPPPTGGSSATYSRPQR